MDILNTVSLESNSPIKINFDGGDLYSDAGLLLFKEFLYKIGAVKLINRMFKTNDAAWFRIHKDDANLTLHTSWRLWKSGRRRFQLSLSGTWLSSSVLRWINR